MKKKLLTSISIFLVLLLGNSCESNSIDTPEENTTEETITEGNIIDLGLSVKWASKNYGASSPEDHGYTEHWEGPSYNSSTGYVAPNTDISGTSYDVARKNMGAPWRIPRKSEVQELFNRCTVTVFTLNDVTGMRFKGPNGNSIFIPFVGGNIGSSWLTEGAVGLYWTSNSNSSSQPYIFTLNNSNEKSIGTGNANFSLEIRPVQ